MCPQGLTQALRHVWGLGGTEVLTGGGVVRRCCYVPSPGFTRGQCGFGNGGAPVGCWSFVAFSRIPSGCI